MSKSEMLVHIWMSIVKRKRERAIMTSAPRIVARSRRRLERQRQTTVRRHNSPSELLVLDDDHRRLRDVNEKRGA